MTKTAQTTDIRSVQRADIRELEDHETDFVGGGYDYLADKGMLIGLLLAPTVLGAAVYTYSAYKHATGDPSYPAQ